MHKEKKALKLLLQAKLLPLYYHDNEETSIDILNALYAGGIRIVEYTDRGKNAFHNFKVLKKIAQKKMPDLLLGIGTIKNKEQAKHFIKAGADFVVCPSVDANVGKMVIDAGLLWIPGCMTATEITIAEKAGATLVKIFPGNILGPTYIRSIKDIFPDLKFIPTGGVEAEETNLREWFKAGVSAVGIGSKLFTKEILEQNKYDELKSSVKNLLLMIYNVTSND